MPSLEWHATELTADDRAGGYYRVAHRLGVWNAWHMSHGGCRDDLATGVTRELALKTCFAHWMIAGAVAMPPTAVVDVSQTVREPVDVGPQS